MGKKQSTHSPWVFCSSFKLRSFTRGQRAGGCSSILAVPSTHLDRHLSGSSWDLLEPLFQLGGQSPNCSNDHRDHCCPHPQILFNRSLGPWHFYTFSCSFFLILLLLGTDWFSFTWSPIWTWKSHRILTRLLSTTFRSVFSAFSFNFFMSPIFPSGCEWSHFMFVHP